MQTRITELLNIKYPIFQGGMAWVADGDLAGAVSNAGGLGIIGGGNAPKEVVKANIDRVKSITDKPFGVNIMLLSPFADDIVDLVIEEGVKVVTTGAGNPGKYMDRFHEAGITVIPVVPSVALAKRMEKLGADAVIAEGMEAGGHIGKLTTMTLVRQVVEAVSIPVIGAGGVADGAGAAAVFMLGAEAVQVGTRFVVAKESNAHQNFKNKILKAKDSACCGTHVERCGQVGSIKLTSAQSYKGGTRVTMLCGMRAYEDHCIKFQNAEAVSGLLSAKINETAAAVQRLADENAALRAEKAALETRLFAADAAAFRGRKNALVFEPHLSPDSRRRLCTALMEQCTGVCAAFSGTDAVGYKYALGSAGGADVHALCNEMNAALGGRGGGREMQQGSAACTRGDIEAFFAPRLGE